MRNSDFSVAVIGGGASGLMASIWAARTAVKLGKKAEIVVFEGNQRVGKKILATGNGRCNLTNRSICAGNFSGSVDLFNSVYGEFDNNALIDFFSDIGMAVRTDNAGRVYPLSNQASSVLDALRYEAQRLGVRFLCETKVLRIDYRDNKFSVNNNGFLFDRCILACGGKACPVHGSDGSGYALLKNFGISYGRIFPALTAIELSGFTKALKGIRAEGRITSEINGKILSSAEGELQYTDYGISGIPAMQISRSVSELINIRKIPEVDIVVDSAPSFSADQLKSFLKNYINANPSVPCEMLLSGIMPKKLGVYILSGLSINPEKSVSVLNSGVLDKIVNTVKSKKYKACGVKGFNDAQITAGGVTGDELDINTLETKKIKGLYICGELVDIDGDCGGYNLQWAFSSGYVAGKNSVLEC